MTMSSVPDTATGFEVRSSRPSLSPEGRPLRVLVVEDDDDSRDMVAEALRSIGYECCVAVDGAEGWDMYRADPPDVVLSDWNMPRVDGIELCQRIREATREGQYTYFIFMTALGDREHMLQGMRAGADDFQSKPIDLDELEARLASAGRVISLNRRLAESNAALRSDRQALFREARVDPLTGVGNRRRMDEDLASAWERARRYRERYSIALCDIDHFKRFNDHFGHLDGDEALRKVAHSIRDALRRADGLYRYGGEELLVLLPEQGLAEATLVMDRVRRALERVAIPTVTERGVVTISAGVAQLSLAHDASVERWVERADWALYQAKSRGRDQVVAADETVDAPPKPSC